MLDSILLSIHKEIISFAKTEDQFLSNHLNKGIFFMPEIAFVYGVGKAIMSKYKEIFLDHKVEWLREIRLEKGGPCDLIFDVENAGKIVIEFKVRSTLEAYSQDVQKLKYLIGDNATRLFCALSNVFEKDLPADLRIKRLEDEYSSSIQRVGDLYNFPTWDVYAHPIYCVIGFWKIQ